MFKMFLKVFLLLFFYFIFLLNAYIHWNVMWCLHFESDSMSIRFIELIVMADFTEISVCVFLCVCCVQFSLHVASTISNRSLRVWMWTIRKFVLSIKWMNSLWSYYSFFATIIMLVYSGVFFSFSLLSFDTSNDSSFIYFWVSN